MTKKKKIILAIVTVVTLATFLGFGAYSNIKKNKIEAEEKAKQALEFNKNLEANSGKTTDLIHQTQDDIVLGDKNAPITIIEYASLSCPHCANFHKDIFSKIKKEYIDTNKVKFIYRNFPLNQSALLANLISSCQAQSNNNDVNKYYSFIGALFKHQDNWAFADNYFEKLRTIAKLNGMTSKQFDQCSTNQELLEEILKKRKRASKELQIESTPSFIFNGKKLVNHHSFEKFKETIEAELKTNS